MNSQRALWVLVGAGAVLSVYLLWPRHHSETHSVATAVATPTPVAEQILDDSPLPLTPDPEVTKKEAATPLLSPPAQTAQTLNIS